MLQLATDKSHLRIIYKCYVIGTQCGNICVITSWKIVHNCATQCYSPAPVRSTEIWREASSMSDAGNWLKQFLQSPLVCQPGGKTDPQWGQNILVIVKHHKCHDDIMVKSGKHNKFIIHKPSCSLLLDFLIGFRVKESEKNNSKFPPSFLS